MGSILNRYSLKASRKLAKEYFPKEWEEFKLIKNSKKRSKKIYKLRERACIEYVMSLLPKEAECRNCINFSYRAVVDDKCCDAQSDSNGYAITQADDCCYKWTKG